MLCARAEPGNAYRTEDQVFVWQGTEFIEIQTGQDVLDQLTFVRKCIEDYWGPKEAKKLNIKTQHEIPQEESEEFMYYFD